MSFPRRLLILAVALVALPHRTEAQVAEPPADAPFQVGPMVLAPVLRLTNVGHDSNVFNTNDNPKADMMAMFSPSVDGWLRMAHGRATGRSQFDLYYFRTLTELRAVDSDHSAQIEIPVNRVKPYFSARVLNTRHRQNLEIDALARRRTSSGTLGMDVRLTSKVTAGLFARRSNLKYEANSLYLGTDLARELNYTSRGEGANIRYALTPLTTISVEAERGRDRFAFGSGRDSNNLWINSGITFAPRALISGHASVGVQRRTFLGGTSPEFTGPVASADLTYTLLGRTRFTVSAARQLEYSYIYSDYVMGGVSLSVAQRFGDSWEVGGSIGRSRLNYRQIASPAGTLDFSDETVLTFGGDVGYMLGHTRLGFYVDHRQRQVDEPTIFRGYQRLRIGSSVAYTF
jgi:hypothetical protein